MEKVLTFVLVKFLITKKHAILAGVGTFYIHCKDCETLHFGEQDRTFFLFELITKYFCPLMNLIEPYKEGKRPLRNKISLQTI